MPFTSDRQHPPGRQFPGFVDHHSLKIGRRALKNPKYKKLHLLTLPAEVRNHIYEEVLVESDNINVPATGMKQPALLRVCGQIRDEVTQMYYGQNIFTLNVQDYDGTAFAPFHKIMMRVFATENVNTENTADTTAEKVAPKLEVVLHGGPSWANLSRWLHAVHAGEMWPIDVHGWDMVSVSNEWMGVLTIFRTLMDAMLHLPWAEVERVLEGMWMMLVMIDHHWV
ncbi:hypothetical protein PRZ48_008851 [Zasmidium cellare]|uniref:Uncharacterized protein n=1 Tax=Zasmidium cellare TaxID=395010 RepID=A0ABR0EGM9_ZASCE|nr:hypothetical protein PRZ48_008851 [Zasmidium cellare]